MRKERDDSWKDAKSEHGAPFAEPVTSEEAPDYGDYILHPMDLGTIADRLKCGHYDSCGEYLAPTICVTCLIQARISTLG